LGLRSETAWLVTGDGHCELGFVLGGSAVGSLTPHLERVGRHLTPHQLDHVARRQAKLVADRIEAGAIFPSHHDDAVDLALSEFGGFDHRFSRTCIEKELVRDTIEPCRSMALQNHRSGERGVTATVDLGCWREPTLIWLQQ